MEILLLVVTVLEVTDVGLPEGMLVVVGEGGERELEIVMVVVRRRRRKRRRVMEFRGS